MMRIPRTFEEFQQSLDLESAPETWPEALRAMWWDSKGDWEASHDIAQEISSEQGNWIHAYLHRKEGDRWNASYWYSRAHREYPTKNLDGESEEIVRYLIGLSRGNF